MIALSRCRAAQKKLRPQRYVPNSENKAQVSIAMNTGGFNYWEHHVTFPLMLRKTEANCWRMTRWPAKEHRELFEPLHGWARPLHFLGYQMADQHDHFAF
jgi:hypothetical protein